MLRWLLAFVVVLGCKAKQAPPEPASASGSATAATKPPVAADAAIAKTDKPMTGTIDEIPLVDLLQLLATSRKTGTLVIEKTAEHEYGELHLREGKVVFARVHGVDQPAVEAAYQILAWTSGPFEMKVAVELGGVKEIEIETPELAMEAMRRIDAARARD